jgi:hypothetical protein
VDTLNGKLVRHNSWPLSTFTEARPDWAKKMTGREPCILVKRFGACVIVSSPLFQINLPVDMLKAKNV